MLLILVIVIILIPKDDIIVGDIVGKYERVRDVVGRDETGRDRD